MLIKSADRDRNAGAGPRQGATGDLGGLSTAFTHSPRLLIAHHGDKRLAALRAALVELDHDAALAATAEEAILAISRGPVPDVLLTNGVSTCPRQGVLFARACIARWPSLRALYVTFLPQAAPMPERPRERSIIAPFNAEELAAALAELCAPAGVAP
jgi:hypothetical protein